MDYARFIRFKRGRIGDITPLLENGKAFRRAIRDMAHPFIGRQIDKVVGIEARGFIFAGAIAFILKAGVVPIRKGGKLPCDVSQEKCIDYTGKKKLLEISQDGIKRGERVLIVDDWFETGGQARAAVSLVQKLGGVVVGFSVLVDDTEEPTRKFLSHYGYYCLIRSRGQSSWPSKKG